MRRDVKKFASAAKFVYLAGAQFVYSVHALLTDATFFFVVTILLLYLYITTIYSNNSYI